MAHFGQMVRKLREEKEWKQKDFARKVGKSDTYLSLIESLDADVVPSEKAGQKIIKVLGVDAKMRVQLERALHQAIRAHKTERIYPSSKLLEEFFETTGISVAEAASRLSTKGNVKRSRSTVQVWKNGRQLPPLEVLDHLLAVFREARLSEVQLDRYKRERLHDAIFFDDLFEGFTDEERRRIADFVVGVVDERDAAQLSLKYAVPEGNDGRKFKVGRKS